MICKTFGLTCNEITIIRFNHRLCNIILFAAKYAGFFSVKIGQPAVFGKIALGLLLGPTLFDIVNWHIGSFYIFGGLDHVSHEAVASLPFAQQIVHSVEAGQDTAGLVLMHTIHDLAELGVLFLMFMAGLETDLKQMMRVGKVALYAAIGGVVGPFFFGAGSGYLFSIWGLNFNIYECIFIGTILTATSVSISAQTLMELGRLKSKEGTTILGAAVIDDVVGIIILSVVIALKPAGGGGHGAEALRDNPNNRRELLEEQRIHRGVIRAGDEAVLARSVKQPDDTYVRLYPQDRLFSHAVGYSFVRQGRAGLADRKAGDVTDVVHELDRRVLAVHDDHFRRQSHQGLFGFLYGAQQ